MTTTHRGPAATRPSNPARHSYTTFELAGGLFGAATDTVKEITVVPPLTPVPHAPAAVRGYVNLRGHIVLVVDVNCLLRRGPAALGPDSRLVVFKPAFRTPDIPPLIPGILVCRGRGTFRKIRAVFWNNTALFSISMVE